MLPGEARERGISLASARGHAPRAIEPGGERIPEHRLRDIRRIAAGTPTEAERRYLRKQAARSGRDIDDLTKNFMSQPQERRDKIREIVARSSRFKAAHPNWSWKNDAPDYEDDFLAWRDDDVDTALLYYH